MYSTPTLFNIKFTNFDYIVSSHFTYLPSNCFQFFKLINSSLNKSSKISLHETQRFLSSSKFIVGQTSLDKMQRYSLVQYLQRWICSVHIYFNLLHLQK